MSEQGGACMPSEFVSLDILVMLHLTYLHFACMHCCRSCTQYERSHTHTHTHTHLFPAQEVGCSLKAGGRAQRQGGLGIMGSQHSLGELRGAAALSVQVCQEGVKWSCGWLDQLLPVRCRKTEHNCISGGPRVCSGHGGRGDS